MESWITQALPGAVAYAASLLGDREQANDVVQECVCRLLAHAARYDLPRDGRRLLFRSITNACINAANRDKNVLSLDDAGRATMDSQWELEDATAVDPALHAIADETHALIHAGLAALPIRQRSAMELWSLGYSADEIAEMLALTAGNVRVLIHRARAALARLLAESEARQERA